MYLLGRNIAAVTTYPIAEAPTLIVLNSVPVHDKGLVVSTTRVYPPTGTSKVTI